MYTKYCFPQILINNVAIGSLSFGTVFTNMPPILIVLATTNGPFSEKNYIQNVQRVYSYTIIQGNSLIKYSLSMYR